MATDARRAFLFGLRADGSPTCHPMVALEQEGAPVFNTYRKSAKTQNFLRDPRAAVLLLDDWHIPPSRAQLMIGVMEQIDPIPPVQAAAPSAETIAADVPGSVAERAQRRAAEGKRIYFRLRTN